MLATITAVVCMVVTGCSRPATEHDASTPPAASGAAANTAALDTGTYPTTLREPLRTAGSSEAGRIVEGRRMAGYVVGPWQVDPKLIRPGSAGAQVITDKLGLGTVVHPEMLTQVGMAPIITGFSCERSAADPADPTSLRNAAVRVADADTANSLAQALAAGGLNMPPAVLKTASMIPTEPIRAIPIPNHPEASGMLLVHNEGLLSVQEVIAISAHGPFVLIQVARSAQGPEQAAAMAGSTLDQQIPLIERFTPTDPAQFASLPLDPSGLLARTVPLKSGQGTTMSDATYDRSGGLQLEDDPVTAGPALDAAAVDVVSTSQTTVYQAVDGPAAQRLSATLADAVAARPGAQAAAAVPGLPQSRCVNVNDTGGIITKFWCTASAENYAFKTVARQLVNAQQQIAAQYKMLAG
jgi:hypothetical protein